MDTQLATVQPAQVVVARQADTDDQLISLWLHGRSPATVRAYRADVDRFIREPLHAVTLGDLQGFADSMTSLSPASMARTLAAIKSLF